MIWATTVSAVSEAQFRKIYQTILAENYFVLSPKLKIIKDPKRYLYTDIINIYANRKEMQSWTVDEAAFLLGHELGHRRAFGSNHSVEYRSDKYGFEYARKAGYNPCRGMLVMLKWRFQKASESHPAPRDRVNRLKRFC